MNIFSNNNTGISFLDKMANIMQFLFGTLEQFSNHIEPFTDNDSKFTFIHVTKCGGMSVEEYFEKHYSDYIIGRDHDTICTNSNNPIIVIREPIDRFKSIYKYWKNGSILWKRNNKFKQKYRNHSIKDMISLIKMQSFSDLYYGFTWNKHFDSQTKWLGNCDYSNIIVIKFVPDMNNKINTLIDQLNIPNKGVSLEKTNISNTDNVTIDLDENDIQWIKQQYKDDFELWEQINANPEKFKMVI